MLTDRLIICISVMGLYSTGGRFNAFALKPKVNLRIFNLHRLQLRVMGYLIPFPALAFVPYRQSLIGIMLSPLVLPLVLKNIRSSPGIVNSSI